MAGVAQPHIHRHLNIHRRFAWQAPSFCVAGVALMALGGFLLEPLKLIIGSSLLVGSSGPLINFHFLCSSPLSFRQVNQHADAWIGLNRRASAGPERVL